MGIIRAAVSSAKSVLADEWREYFYCNAMDPDVLVVKGSKRSGKGNSNTKGSDNVISNGSIIAINEGQCALIVDQGKVVDICAETGEFLYDTSSQPSIFYGGLGKGIEDSFGQFGMRVGFGGDTATDQRIYFVNIKDIISNKYGTPEPVPFRVVDQNIGLDVDISIRCHGEYSYKIVNPILFYANVCGNVETDYRREQIDSQLKTELLTALQPAFGKLSEMGIRYSSLPVHAMEMADALNEILSGKWQKTYGIVISAFGISSATASEEDEAMIKELQKGAVLRNPGMAAAALTAAQAEAMKSAAANTATGPMFAFSNMNAASAAGGINTQQLFQMEQENRQMSNQQAMMQQQLAAQQAMMQQSMAQQTRPDQTKASAQSASWTCECGMVNTGNFCSNCGKSRPKPASWTCSCGTVNTGNFCSNCGKPRNA
ncbi:MAG: SPFH domain-containing protein [Butyrivibrio sp.]|nr:SPFH domain-containing protein [Butyrivibrio sp.]